MNIKIKQLKNSALKNLQNGQYEKALEEFSEICHLHDKDAESWFMLGAISGHLGRLDNAIKFCNQATMLKPDYAEAYFNMAQAYLQKNLPSQASEILKTVLRIKPYYTDALRALCKALKAENKKQEAIQYHQQLIRNDNPTAWDYANMGLIYFESKLYKKAIELFIQALTLAPDDADIQALAGNCYRLTGQLEKAANHFKRAIKIKPDMETAKYYLAAVDKNTRTPDISPSSFVKNCYNTISTTYDNTHTAKRLGYRVPQQLTDEIKKRIPQGSMLEIIDVGCGTGLCGSQLKDITRNITGVDLSEGMLKLAKEKNVYDNIICADLITTLAGYTNRFDLVISTGVFIHFGDLAPVFKASHQALKPEGLFAFSIHKHTEEQYFLNPTGHYSHSASYVGQLSKENGFQEKYKKEVIIYNQDGEDVLGFLYILTAIK